MRFISVIVPTRNRAGVLPGLLEALDSQAYPEYEVIVVDDASDDETPDVLAAWEREGRTAVRLHLPSGSYAARNVGWQRARGEIIAFTDDDCLPDRDWLVNLAEAMRHPETVGAQGVTIANLGEITPFTHQIEQRCPGPPYRTCNIAYRRSLLARFGGFEAMRWYADNILGLRARRQGEIAFAPGAVVLHPPRARGWRDRAAWLARFEADAAHQRWLRDLDEEHVKLGQPGLPLVLWVLRPLAKQSLAHAQYLIRHPLRYLNEVRPMLQEKLELLAALRAYRGNTPRSAAGILPPLESRPLVSVVVVTRDRPDSLRCTLDALAEQTYPCIEVVVVDHSLRASSRPVAKAVGSRWIGAQGTLASARQRGVEAASGGIIAFVDDDCLPDAGWAESLITAFRSSRDAWGVQGRTMAGRGAIGNHAVAVSGPDPLYRTCNIAYRRGALDAVGGFDERFEGWFEDTALGARVVERGEIVFTPAALVTHRAMPRRPMDRDAWRWVLADERLLATAYSDFYHRTRGPGFVPVVVARWLIGSPLKTLWREMPRGLQDPAAYRDLLLALLGERLELLHALARMLFRPAPIHALPLTPDVERVAHSIAEE